MNSRYSRQRVIPEIGEEGQEKLSRGRVLVVGAGGLGSPAIAYLAAAGVGHLHVADGDFLELSNLNRQFLHQTENLGMPKAESARHFVEKFNPDVELISIEGRVGKDSPLKMGDFDLVLDCTDSFESRFLLNRLCLAAERPLIHGAVTRFMGQASTFLPGGPCYRCLLPQLPKNFPSPALSGVLGATAGLIGSIQAMEAVKWLLKEGELLSGRLLVYDGMRMAFSELPIRKNPLCPDCGESQKERR
ncbi:MAG TPA: HesA/MoeB/ThiF family protein [Chroococcales cyanobacterium]